MSAVFSGPDSEFTLAMNRLYIELGKRLEQRNAVARGERSADTMGRSVIDLNTAVSEIAKAIDLLALAASHTAMGGPIV